DLTALSRDRITKQEMETLRRAMVGDPSLVGAGIYSSRGFRGDVGRFPANAEGLPALVTNPGDPAWNRYTRTGWNGPYVDANIGDEFGQTNSYLRDAWGNNYVYDSTVSPPTITSCGPNGSCGDGDDLVVYLRFT
ncbi:MAG: type II secretion system protein GspG, partial [Thermodesulfobacteriota bacterium]